METEKIASECEGKLLYCEGDGALERVARGGFGVSPLEILKTCLDMILCNVPTSDAQTGSVIFFTELIEVNSEMMCKYSPII